MWVSLASVQPPVQLAGSNSARTVRRLLALADVAAVESDHYLVGSAAKEILSAAADDLEFSSDSGRERARMVSPQLLSLLLLSWSELPVDHPGQRLCGDPVVQPRFLPWRSSKVEPHILEPTWQPRWVHCAYDDAGDMARGSINVVTSGHVLQVAVMDTGHSRTSATADT